MDEQVWEKKGSRLRLPRAHISVKYLWAAIPILGLASSVLVGSLTASSSPPPPAPYAYGIAPTVSSEPTDQPVVIDLPTAPPAPQPPPPVCHPRGTGTGVSPPTNASSNASLIAYSRNGSIWLYDIAKDVRHLLVKASDGCEYVAPKFVDRRTVAFEGGPSGHLETVDIVTGAMRPLATHLSDSDSMIEFATTDDSLLAVLGGPGESPLHLVVSSRSSGAALFSKRIGYLCACDGTYLPITLEWSRDGTLLLAGVSTLNGPGSVYVFDRQGHEAAKPLGGGDAHWIGATHTFLYNAAVKTYGEWTIVDVGTGARRRFLSAPTLSTPTVSFDGEKIAFSDLTKGSIAIYDFKSSTLRHYGREQLYPVWLDGHTVAVSGVARCNCEGTGYNTTGTVRAIDLVTRTGSPLHLSDTLDDDILY